jgi:hypothetical protein
MYFVVIADIISSYYNLDFFNFKENFMFVHKFRKYDYLYFFFFENNSLYKNSFYLNYNIFLKENFLNTNGIFLYTIIESIKFFFSAYIIPCFYIFFIYLESIFKYCFISFIFYIVYIFDLLYLFVFLYFIDIFFFKIIFIIKIFFLFIIFIFYCKNNKFKYSNFIDISIPFICLDNFYFCLNFIKNIKFSKFYKNK